MELNVFRPRATDMSLLFCALTIPAVTMAAHNNAPLIILFIFYITIGGPYVLS